jgi:hypothetical protein
VEWDALKIKQNGCEKWSGLTRRQRNAGERNYLKSGKTSSNG